MWLIDDATVASRKQDVTEWKRLASAMHVENQISVLAASLSV